MISKKHIDYLAKTVLPIIASCAGIVTIYRFFYENPFGGFILCLVLIVATFLFVKRKYLKSKTYLSYYSIFILLISLVAAIYLKNRIRKVDLGTSANKNIYLDVERIDKVSSDEFQNEWEIFYFLKNVNVKSKLLITSIRYTLPDYRKCIPGAGGTTFVRRFLTDTIYLNNGSEESPDHSIMNEDGFLVLDPLDSMPFKTKVVVFWPGLLKIDGPGEDNYEMSPEYNLNKVLRKGGAVYSGFILDLTCLIDTTYVSNNMYFIINGNKLCYFKPWEMTSVFDTLKCQNIASVQLASSLAKIACDQGNDMMIPLLQNFLSNMINFYNLDPLWLINDKILDLYYYGKLETQIEYLYVDIAFYLRLLIFFKEENEWVGNYLEYKYLD